MSVLDVDCLQSEVRNVSGGTLFFHFLGPHGKTLAANAVYTCYGDIMADVGRGFKRTIRILHMLEAVQAGLLDIVFTPSPLLQDKGHNVTHMITANNDKLNLEDPCWKNASTGLAVSIP